MTWDLGIQGVGALVVMSLAFGAFTEFVLGRSATHRPWLVASGVSFVAALLISEVWFGWATAEELQPNIDGLSFDEVLLGYVAGVAIVLVAWYLRRPGRVGGPRVP